MFVAQAPVVPGGRPLFLSSQKIGRRTWSTFPDSLVEMSHGDAVLLAERLKFLVVEFNGSKVIWLATRAQRDDMEQEEGGIEAFFTRANAIVAEVLDNPDGSVCRRKSLIQGRFVQSGAPVKTATVARAA